MNTDERPESEPAETRLIRLAGNLMARSQTLEGRIAAIESAAQTCNCAKIVSETVLELLTQAANILEKMRYSTDIEAKNIFSEFFTKILVQMDAVVTESVYDDKNLAKSDSITIYTDETRGHGFSIDGIDMSPAGFGLLPFDHTNVSNSEIIERLIKVEQAKNSLSTHSYSYLTISEMLNTHMKFARGMIDILDDGSAQIKNSRAGQDAMAHILSKVYTPNSHSELGGAQVGHSLEDGTNDLDKPVDTDRDIRI
jgi:hypothetical protein